MIRQIDATPLRNVPVAKAPSRQPQVTQERDPKCLDIDEPFGRNSSQSFVNDGGERVGEIGSMLLDRFRRLLQNQQQLLGDLLRKVLRVPLRQQVVQRGRRRVLIRGRSDIAIVGDLLGSHERQRAANVSGRREAAEFGCLIGSGQTDIWDKQGSP